MGYKVSVAGDLFPPREITGVNKANPQPYAEHDGIPYLMMPPNGNNSNRFISLLKRFDRVSAARWLRRQLELSTYTDWLGQVVNPHILHAHTPYYAARQALKMGRDLGVPAIFEVRGFWSLSEATEEKRSPNLSKAVAPDIETGRRASHIVAICRGIADLLVREGIPAGKISIVPNGVDTTHFKPRLRDDELASTLGLDNHTIYAYATNVRRLEGIQTIIEAWPSVIDAVPNAVFLLIGDGPYLEILKKMVRERGLDRSFRFIGSVPYHEMPSYFSIFDVFVVPRIPEPVCEIVTPLKPLEAMAMEIPVIASDVAALREIIIDGYTGILFESGNPVSLTAACVRLAKDTNLRNTLASGAAIWVRNERDWVAVTRLYNGVYRQLVQSS